MFFTGIMLLVMAIIGVIATYIVCAYQGQEYIRGCMMLIFVMMPSTLMFALGTYLVMASFGYDYPLVLFIGGFFSGAAIVQILSSL